MLPYPTDLPDAVVLELLESWDWGLGDATAFVSGGLAAALFATGNYEPDEATAMSRTIMPPGMHWDPLAAEGFRETVDARGLRPKLEELLSAQLPNGSSLRDTLRFYALAVLSALEAEHPPA